MRREDLETDNSDIENGVSCPFILAFFSNCVAPSSTFILSHITVNKRLWTRTCPGKMHFSLKNSCFVNTTPPLYLFYSWLGRNFDTKLRIKCVKLVISYFNESNNQTVKTVVFLSSHPNEFIRAGR